MELPQAIRALTRGALLASLWENQGAQKKQQLQPNELVLLCFAPCLTRETKSKIGIRGPLKYVNKLRATKDERRFASSSFHCRAGFFSLALRAPSCSRIHFDAFGHRHGAIAARPAAARRPFCIGAFLRCGILGGVHFVRRFGQRCGHISSEESRATRTHCRRFDPAFRTTPSWRAGKAQFA